MSERVAELVGQRGAILDRLLTLIRFPSVSTDPAFAEGMRGARDFLLDRLRAIGMRELGCWRRPADSLPCSAPGPALGRTSRPS